MTIAQRIEEILKDDKFHWQCCSGDYCEATQEDMDKDLKSCTQAILKCLVEELPQPIDMKYSGDEVGDLLRDVRNEFGVGWNDCLSEIKELLK